MIRKCPSCKTEYELTKDNFYTCGIKNGIQKYQYMCKRCWLDYIKKRKGPEEFARLKEYNRKIRKMAIDAYGGKCNCCGETTHEFLGIDHINGGGSKHRRELVNQGTTVYLWLKKNQYPLGYQVLCHNCNLAKGFYGKCPHNIKT